jgi:hypothetical protein
VLAAGKLARLVSGCLVGWLAVICWLLVALYIVCWLAAGWWLSPCG